MAIFTSQGFDPRTQEPIDSRQIAANEAARLALSAFVSHEGLIVYQEDNDTLYVLTDATDPSSADSWTEVGSGAGNASISRGTTLPATGEENELFYLTAAQGTNTVGLYINTSTDENNPTFVLVANLDTTIPNTEGISGAGIRYDSQVFSDVTQQSNTVPGQSLWTFASAEDATRAVNYFTGLSGSGDTISYFEPSFTSPVVNTDTSTAALTGVANRVLFTWGDNTLDFSATEPAFELTLQRVDEKIGELKINGGGDTTVTRASVRPEFTITTNIRQFGNADGEIATWAEGDDTTTIPRNKLPNIQTTSVEAIAVPIIGNGLLPTTDGIPDVILSSGGGQTPAILWQEGTVAIVTVTRTGATDPDENGTTTFGSFIYINGSQAAAAATVAANWRLLESGNNVTQILAGDGIAVDTSTGVVTVTNDDPLAFGTDADEVATWAQGDNSIAGGRTDATLERIPGELITVSIPDRTTSGGNVPTGGVFQSNGKVFLNISGSAQNITNGQTAFPDATYLNITNSDYRMFPATQTTIGGRGILIDGGDIFRIIRTVSGTTTRETHIWVGDETFLAATSTIADFVANPNLVRIDGGGGAGSVNRLSDIGDVDAALSDDDFGLALTIGRDAQGNLAWLAGIPATVRVNRTINRNPRNGQLGVNFSDDAGNILNVGSDGGLYAAGLAGAPPRASIVFDGTSTDFGDEGMADVTFAASFTTIARPGASALFSEAGIRSWFEPAPTTGLFANPWNGTDLAGMEGANPGWDLAADFVPHFVGGRLRTVDTGFDGFLRGDPNDAGRAFQQLQLNVRRRADGGNAIMQIQGTNIFLVNHAGGYLNNLLPTDAPANLYSVRWLHGAGPQDFLSSKLSPPDNTPFTGQFLWTRVAGFIKLYRDRNQTQEIRTLDPTISFAAGLQDDDVLTVTQGTLTITHTFSADDLREEIPLVGVTATTAAGITVRVTRAGNRVTTLPTFRFTPFTPESIFVRAMQGPAQETGGNVVLDTGVGTGGFVRNNKWIGNFQNTAQPDPLENTVAGVTTLYPIERFTTAQGNEALGSFVNGPATPAEALIFQDPDVFQTIGSAPEYTFSVVNQDPSPAVAPGEEDAYRTARSFMSTDVVDGNGFVSGEYQAAADDLANDVIDDIATQIVAGGNAASRNAFGETWTYDTDNNTISITSSAGGLSGDYLIEIMQVGTAVAANTIAVTYTSMDAESDVLLVRYSRDSSGMSSNSEAVSLASNATDEDLLNPLVGEFELIGVSDELDPSRPNALVISGRTNTVHPINGIDGANVDWLEAYVYNGRSVNVTVDIDASPGDTSITLEDALDLAIGRVFFNGNIQHTVESVNTTTEVITITPPLETGIAEDTVIPVNNPASVSISIEGLNNRGVEPLSIESPLESILVRDNITTNVIDGVEVESRSGFELEAPQGKLYDPMHSYATGDIVSYRVSNTEPFISYTARTPQPIIRERRVYSNVNVEDIAAGDRFIFNSNGDLVSFATQLGLDATLTTAQLITADDLPLALELGSAPGAQADVFIGDFFTFDGANNSVILTRAGTTNVIVTADALGQPLTVQSVTGQNFIPTDTAHWQAIAGTGGGGGSTTLATNGGLRRNTALALEVDPNLIKTEWRPDADYTNTAGAIVNIHTFSGELEYVVSAPTPTGFPSKADIPLWHNAVHLPGMYTRLEAGTTGDPVDDRIFRLGGNFPTSATPASGAPWIELFEGTTTDPIVQSAAGQYRSLATGGVASTDLTDAPDSYGTTGQALVVNAAADGLVYADVSGGGTPTPANVIARREFFGSLESVTVSPSDTPTVVRDIGLDLVEGYTVVSTNSVTVPSGWSFSVQANHDVELTIPANTAVGRYKWVQNVNINRTVDNVAFQIGIEGTVQVRQGGGTAFTLESVGATETLFGVNNIDVNFNNDGRVNITVQDSTEFENFATNVLGLTRPDPADPQTQLFRNENSGHILTTTDPATGNFNYSISNPSNITVNWDTSILGFAIDDPLPPHYTDTTPEGVLVSLHSQSEVGAGDTVLIQSESAIRELVDEAIQRNSLSSMVRLINRDPQDPTQIGNDDIFVNSFIQVGGRSISNFNTLDPQDLHINFGVNDTPQSRSIMRGDHIAVFNPDTSDTTAYIGTVQFVLAPQAVTGVVGDVVEGIISFDNFTTGQAISALRDWITTTGTQTTINPALYNLRSGAIRNDRFYRIEPEAEDVFVFTNPHGQSVLLRDDTRPVLIVNQAAFDDFTPEEGSRISIVNGGSVTARRYIAYPANVNPFSVTEELPAPLTTNGSTSSGYVSFLEASRLLTMPGSLATTTSTGIDINVTAAAQVNFSATPLRNVYTSSSATDSYGVDQPITTNTDQFMRIATPNRDTFQAQVTHVRNAAFTDYEQIPNTAFLTYNSSLEVGVYRWDGRGWIRQG